MSTKHLIENAIIAQNRAVATYSNYPVGVALISTDKKIILGCNIESKAYPTTLCAERVAIFSAISQGYSEFIKMALITNDGAYPCGSCRQIIHEFLGDIPLIIATSITEYNEEIISNLLPYPFG